MVTNLLNRVTEIVNECKIVSITTELIEKDSYKTTIRGTMHYPIVIAGEIKTGFLIKMDNTKLKNSINIISESMNLGNVFEVMNIKEHTLDLSLNLLPNKEKVIYTIEFI